MLHEGGNDWGACHAEEEERGRAETYNGTLLLLLALFDVAGAASSPGHDG